MLIVNNLINFVILSYFVEDWVKLFRLSIQIASKPVLKVLYGELELLLILLDLLLKPLIFIESPDIGLCFSKVSRNDSLSILCKLPFDLVI